MLGWIKKRCRRRSDPVGGKLREFAKGLKDVEGDFPLYFTLEGKVNADILEEEETSDCENHYEEVINSKTIKEITHTSVTANTSLPITGSNHCCPLCRQRLSRNILCKCTKTFRFTEEPIYELAKSPFKKRSTRRNSYAFETNSRPLPDIPIARSKIEDTTSEDESSGYESIGSDTSSVNQIYSDYECIPENTFTYNLCTTIIPEDSDYEEIEIKQNVVDPRFSLGSAVPTTCSRDPILLDSRRSSEKPQIFKRTITRQAQLFRPRNKLFKKRT